MSDNSGGSAGIGAITIIGIVFVTLKLLDVIDWSWWWVSAPFWGQGVLIAVVVAIALWAAK